MGKCPYKKILDELTPCECFSGYCFYKMYFDMVKFDPRTLVQLKVIEIFKWEKNKGIAEDIGWEKATELWVTSGNAKIFSEVYTEDLSAKEIYKIMFPEDKENG